MEHGEDVALVQLSTRIPKSLHRKVKLHCARAATGVMDFVAMALEEKLAALSETPGATRGKPHRRNSRSRWPLGTLSRRAPVKR